MITFYNRTRLQYTDGGCVTRTRFLILFHCSHQSSEIAPLNVPHVQDTRRAPVTAMLWISVNALSLNAKCKATQVSFVIKVCK